MRNAEAASALRQQSYCVIDEFMVRAPPPPTQHPHHLLTGNRRRLQGVPLLRSVRQHLRELVDSDQMSTPEERGDVAGERGDLALGVSADEARQTACMRTLVDAVEQLVQDLSGTPQHLH